MKIICIHFVKTRIKSTVIEMSYKKKKIIILNDTEIKTAHPLEMEWV